MNRREVAYCSLHQPFQQPGVPGLSNLGKHLVDSKEHQMGIKMWYTPDGIEVSYKGYDFIVPLANVAGATFRRKNETSMSDHNDSINESHRLQSLVKESPKSTDSKVFILWAGPKFTVSLNWTDQSYLFRSRDRGYEISESRLGAFGVYLRNLKFSDKLCDLILDYLEHYDSRFRRGGST